jgi:two-component system nitrate/nitrite response regulator NarL
MHKVVRVVVVDDHPLFREGVASLFLRSRRHELVGKGSDAAQALQLATELLPDILLLDINLPGNGLSVVCDIKRTCPLIKIVMLTSSEDGEHVAEALAQGASGYLLKGIGGEALLETVDAIDAGETYVSPGLAARLLHRLSTHQSNGQRAHDVSALTHREDEILEQVTTGRTNKEIARQLNISEKTVKHYMTNILNKLQVRNRVEAAIIGRERKAAS